MEIYNDKYCVYMHTNKINGKKYVGQTCNSTTNRWHRGKGYKKCTYFWNAIQKYGWDNFEHEIIASNLTKEEADNFEKLLIRKLDLTNKEKGYNLRSGGSHGEHSEETKQKLREASLSKTVSKETREKISKATKGENNPFYGKKHTEDTKEKIRLSHIGVMTGSQNPNFNGRCCTEEWRKKQSESHRGQNSGKDNYGAKSVTQYDKNYNTICVWDCIQDAANNLKINQAHIVSCCKGRRKTTGGFIWKYTIQN